MLARLQNGEFIGAICLAASEEMAGVGIQVAVSTLRAEFSKWCETASWGEQLRAALNVWKRSSSGEMVLTKEWQDDFLAAMERCEGNAQKAAQMAGIGYGIVLAVTDRRHKCYDAEFTEKFKIAELSRIAGIREQYMLTAEAGGTKEAMRAQEKLIESALPGLHGQKQEVVVTGDVNHKHQHLHGMTQQLTEAIVNASQDRVRKLNSGRQGLLPEDTRESDGRVIDLTPIRERASA